MVKNCCLSLILLQLFYYLPVVAQKKQPGDIYSLAFHIIDKNTTFNAGALKLETAFRDEISISQYINKSMIRVVI